MARTKKTRRYYRKGRWSSNIVEITNQNLNFTTNNYSYGDYVLCTNPAQSTNLVTQQYTVKNIEFSFELQTNSSTSAISIESLIAYIIFVPEGMTVTADYANKHPEYIMGYKFYGSPQFETADNNNGVIGVRNPLRIKTRLARRLNTGDTIRLLITGYNQSTTTQVNCTINGLLRWWTKAN